MIQVRKTQPVIATNIESVETGNRHVLGFAHFHETGPLLVLGNFSEHPQTINVEMLHSQGLSWPAVDLITGSYIGLDDNVALSPYQLAWLKPM